MSKRSRASRSMRWRGILALGLALVSGAAAAQEFTRDPPSVALSGEDAQALQPLVDRLAGGFVAQEAPPGLIVGVSWQGRRSFFGYTGGGDPPFGPDTIVEIGSITKVFTTALFAQALIEGRMRRDEPIQAYLPDRRLPPCTGRITPLQLADFQSGMPRLPGNVPRQLAARGIETYTSNDFLAWLDRWAPEGSEAGECPLPAPYRYSNASVGLLGYLVADRLGAPWQELVRERITGPLHMTSTAVTVLPDRRGRLAQGYGADGQAVIPWPLFAWYAAGALRSSARDMLAFGEAALGHRQVEGRPVPPELNRALADAMAPIYQPEGQVSGQGMAWVEDVGDADAGQRPVFYKDGGTDGFASVIVVNPGKDLAVFVAANRPKGGLPRLGIALSRQIR